MILSYNNMNTSNTVKKSKVSNPSIERSKEILHLAPYHLTYTEYKIQLYMLSQIHIGDAPNKLYMIHIDKLYRMLKKRISIDDLADALMNIYRKSFWIKEGNTDVLCCWFRKILLNPTEMIVEYDLHSSIAAYLLLPSPPKIQIEKE